MQERAGVKYVILHGCAKCNRFVYVPSDERKNCPYVQENGRECGAARFDEDGKPQEVCTQVLLNPKPSNTKPHTQHK